MSEARRLNVLRVWTGGDAEGREVRDVVALSLTPEQEAALVGSVVRS